MNLMRAQTAAEKSYCLNSTKDFASKLNGSIGMVFEMSCASNQRMEEPANRT